MQVIKEGIILMKQTVERTHMLDLNWRAKVSTQTLSQKRIKENQICFFCLNCYHRYSSWYLAIETYEWCVGFLPNGQMLRAGNMPLNLPAFSLSFIMLDFIRLIACPVSVCHQK